MHPDFGVHREGKINRCRTLRKLDDVTRGREDENLVLVKIELEELQKLVGSLGVELELEYLPEPLERAVQLVGTARIFLEAPVRRNSVFGGSVHLAGADLNLEQLPSRP